MDRDTFDLDALWDFDDAVESERRFREALVAAPVQGDPILTARTHTQLARALGLQRRFDEANRTLEQVNAESTMTDPETRVRERLERGRLLNSSGERAKARPHFERAYEDSVEAGLDALAVDAAHMVAIVSGSPAEAMTWNERALDVAEHSDEPNARRWRGSVLNNVGWTHFDGGDYEQAFAVFERALEARREQGDAKLITIARWCIAKTLRVMGRSQEALTILLDLEMRAARDEYVHEEIGECLLALDRVDEAVSHFAKAYEILSRDCWLQAHETDRLERLHRLARASDQRAT